MKKTKLILVLMVAITLATLPGCKRGCKDLNSDNYNPKKKLNGSKCVYRYLTSVDVSYFPHQYQSGAPWDTTIQHNIGISFSRGGADHVFFPQLTNSNTVTFVPTNAGQKLWNESYCYELFDSAASFADGSCYTIITPGNGAVIASGSINPLELGSDGKITINSTNGTVITFNYEVHE